MKQLQVIFSGQVQMVGFRFFAQEIANQLNLKGWVKNLDDGQVELVAEGNEKNLKELLQNPFSSL